MAFKIDPLVASQTSVAPVKLVSSQWKSIEIQFGSNSPRDTVYGVRGIDFETTVSNDEVKGLKDQVVVTTIYDKVRTGSITLLQSEVELWHPDGTSGYSLIDVAEFDIVITVPTGNPSALTYVKHTLVGCRFTNDPRSFQQSDAEPEVTLNLSISDIKYGVAKS